MLASHVPFVTPATFSKLQLQPPRACSGFLLLSEGLKSQDLVSPAVRTLPTAVLCWDPRPPYPEPARKRRGRESLQPPGPAPSNNKFINSKQNIDCGGNWFCLGLSRLGLRLRRWIQDSERKRSREVISVLLDKERFLCPFRQVDISLSI